MNNTVVGFYNNYKKLSKISSFKCLYALTLEVEGYTGPLIEVYAVDSATNLDIYPLPNGKLDIVALLAHCDGGDGEITTWYDEKEFSDAVAVNRPQIVNAGVLNTENGEPAILFDNTNDFLTITTPYVASQAVVSVLSVQTCDVTGTNDWTLGANPNLSGFDLFNDTSDRYTFRTTRTATTTVKGVASTVSDTYICGGVADRSTIKYYENGVLVDSDTDDNSDFVAVTNMRIGATAAGSGVFSGTMQFLGVTLTDESDNMEELYNELHSRYDSTVPNPRIYFSDSPELLANGEDANGRLVGDISFSEQAKIFAWASRPTGGFGAIDIINNDNEYNDLVDNPRGFFEIFEPIRDPTRFMNKDVEDYSSAFDDWTIEEDGASLNIYGDGTKAIQIEPYIVTANTRLRFDFKATGAEPFYAEIAVDVDNTGPLEGWWQLYGTLTSGANQDYNNYTGSDWTSYIIDVGSESLGDTIRFIDFYNGQDTTNNIYFRNVFMYEEGENLIDYYEKFGSGRIDNVGYIEKKRVRTKALNALDRLNKSINPYIFDVVTYSELENVKPPIIVGDCLLTEPLISKSSTLEYYCQADAFSVDAVYDNAVAVLYSSTTDGFTLTNNPVGRIRADVQGAKEGISYKEKINEIVPYLLEAINIYEYSLTDLEAMTNGFDLCWTGQEETAIDVITWLTESLIGFLYPDKNGVLRFGTLEAPSSTTTLVEREIHGEPKAFKDTAENLSNYVAGEKNWHPYDKTEMAFAAVAADKITFAKDYRSVEFADISGLNENQLDNPSFKTLLRNSADVTTIAASIATLFNTQRYFYTISTHRKFSIGEHVNVTYAWKGLSSGKDLVCIGRQLSVNNNITTYSFWG